MTTQSTDRPEPLRKPYGTDPAGRKFAWGPIVKVHEIGEYQIVEFLRDLSNFHLTGQANPYADHGATQFHPYINGRDTGTYYRTLDSALVGCVAYKREGPNGRAADYFDRMTLPTDQQDPDL